MTTPPTPPDGPPVDMGEVSLGARYGSEDMYRDMGIDRPDEGVVFVDTVQAVTVQVAEDGMPG